MTAPAILKAASIVVLIQKAMKLISLTKNKFAKVDDDVFDTLNQLKWHFDGYYARRNLYADSRQIHILMHRLIAGAKEGELVDHRNGDPLDNRKENLRICNRSNNAMNMRKHRGASIYKGVSKHENSWRTQIWHNNEKVFGATFPNERWAAYAYDLNASALFGEYARLNFSTETVAMSVDASSSSPLSEDSHIALS